MGGLPEFAAEMQASGLENFTDLPWAPGGQVLDDHPVLSPLRSPVLGNPVTPTSATPGPEIWSLTQSYSFGFLINSTECVVPEAAHEVGLRALEGRCRRGFFSTIFRQFRQVNCRNSGLDENFSWVRQKFHWLRPKNWPYIWQNYT